MPGLDEVEPTPYCSVDRCKSRAAWRAWMGDPGERIGAFCLDHMPEFRSAVERYAVSMDLGWIIVPIPGSGAVLEAVS